MSYSESTQTSSPPNLFLFSPDGELKETAEIRLGEFTKAEFEDFIYFRADGYWMQKLKLMQGTDAFIWRGVRKDCLPLEVKAMALLL